MTSSEIAVQGPSLNLAKESIVQPQFFNPTPVGVLLVPVVEVSADGTERTGILTIRRSIEPMKGGLALPGGYLEYEDWRDGMRREVFEETGIALNPHRPILPFDIASVDHGKKLLIFGLSEPILRERLQQFAVNSEVSELVVIFEPQQLAFSTHTEVVGKFFKGQARSAPAKAKSIPTAEPKLEAVVADEPKNIHDAIAEAAREVLSTGARIVGLVGASPSGWEVLARSAKHEGASVKLELYADGTNWGWNDCEDITVNGGGKEIKICWNYPYGLQGVSVNNVVVPKEGRVALRAIQEAADLLSKFPQATAKDVVS